ncbi:MAG TPA: hypothetical protein VJJ47_03545 [Candidatus Paceibacterota bacterium]
MRTIKAPFVYGLVALINPHALKRDYKLGTFNPNNPEHRRDCWLFRTLEMPCPVEPGYVVATGVCESHLTVLRKFVLPPTQLKLDVHVPEKFWHLDGLLLCRFLPWQDGASSASVTTPAHSSSQCLVLRGHGFLPPNDRSDEARLITAAIGIQAATDYQFAGPFEGSDEHTFMLRVANMGDPAHAREFVETLAEVERRETAKA